MIRSHGTESKHVAKWARRRRWPQLPNGSSKSLRLVDLFCGCGGLTLGVCEAARKRGRRLEIRLAVDFASEPLKVYRSNYECKTNAVRQADIVTLFSGQLGAPRTSKERYWRGRVGELDLLVAGPPCQGHSDLNNSSRRNDPRNRLYLTAIRAVEVLRPKLAIIENVPAVVHDRHRVVQQAREALARIGEYQISDEVVLMSQLGVPQQRRRHVLVASRCGEFDITSVLRPSSGVLANAGTFLDGLEDEPSTKVEPFYQPSRMNAENERRVRYLFEKDVHNLPDRLRPACHRDKNHSYVSMYGRMYWDKPAQTITSGFGSMGQGRFVHPTRPRMLTPHEAARLQGFPDYYDFSSASGVTALREMIGNAVPPQLTAVLVSHAIRLGLL